MAAKKSKRQRKEEAEKAARRRLSELRMEEKARQSKMQAAESEDAKADAELAQEEILAISSYIYQKMKERMDKTFAGNDKIVVFCFGQSHEIWKYAKDMVKTGEEAEHELLYPADPAKLDRKKLILAYYKEIGVEDQARIDAALRAFEEA